MTLSVWNRQQCSLVCALRLVPPACDRHPTLVVRCTCLSSLDLSTLHAHGLDRRSAGSESGTVNTIYGRVSQVNTRCRKTRVGGSSRMQWVAKNEVVCSHFSLCIFTHYAVIVVYPPPPPPPKDPAHRTTAHLIIHLLPLQLQTSRGLRIPTFPF